MSEVTGVKAMRNNIKMLKAAQRGRVFKGLIIGGLLVKKDAQKETPRRTGNLRAGAYLVTPTETPDEGGAFSGEGSNRLRSSHNAAVQGSQAAAKQRSQGSDATVAVGFTPFYALIVHENPRAGEAGYNPSNDRPGLTASRVHSRVGGWKYLSNALQGAPGRVKQAIAAAAKLPQGPVRR